MWAVGTEGTQLAPARVRKGFGALVLPHQVGDR